MTQNLIPLAQPADTTVTMTSHELVEFINNHRKEQAEGSGYAFPSKGFAKLEHKNFLPKVPEVLGVETSAKFLADLPDSYGRLQPAYRFPKREATLMAMSYSYALQAAVYDHMTALEAKAAAPDLNTDEGKLLLIQDLAAKQLALLADNKRIQLERDEAIRTKAQISDRKTATAMATASAATKKAKKLEIELDRSKQYATVKRMEMLYHGQIFNWRLLKSASADVGMPPVDVFDANYGKVKAYHADAWMEAYALPIATNDCIALEQ